ncbi:hypothetical protein [Nitrospira sp. Kam-Ns4a]
MDEEPHPYQEGKRAGAHPVLVIFGVIIGLWIFIWVVVPGSKSQRQQSGLPDPARDSASVVADEAPIMFHISATVPEMNAISVLVPEQATTSQIIALLKRFKEARLTNQLSTMLPPTTPGNKLGDHAIADIYIFSNPKYGSAEAIQVLSRGAHAPGALYPNAIPFEDAMEHVRGHYRIDLRDPGKSDQASLGFADESGVHSKNYKRLF